MNSSRLTLLMQPFIFVILLCLCAASTCVRGLEQPLGPQTVMWVVIKDAKSPAPYWMNADLPEGAAIYLEKLGAKRGIPIVLPLFDLADTHIVTEQHVLEGNINALQKASERYHAEAILIAKIEQTPEGQWIAEWTSSMNGKTSNFEARHADFNGVLNAGVSGFLTRLVGQAVEPRQPLMAQNDERLSTDTDQAVLQKIENNIANKSDSQETNSTEPKKTIKLSISGIMGVAHYAKVLEYLKQLLTMK